MEKFQRNLLSKIEDELLTMQRAGIANDAENYTDLPADTKQKYSRIMQCLNSDDATLEKLRGYFHINPFVQNSDVKIYLFLKIMRLSLLEGEYSEDAIMSIIFEYSKFKSLTDLLKIEDDQTCSLPYNFLLLFNSWLTYLVMLEAALLIKLKRSDFDPDIQQAKRNVSMALGYRHAINAPTLAKNKYCT